MPADDFFHGIGASDPTLPHYSPITGLPVMPAQVGAPSKLVHPTLDFGATSSDGQLPLFYSLDEERFHRPVDTDDTGRFIRALEQVQAISGLVVLRVPLGNYEVSIAEADRLDSPAQAGVLFDTSRFHIIGEVGPNGELPIIRVKGGQPAWVGFDGQHRVLPVIYFLRCSDFEVRNLRIDGNRAALVDPQRYLQSVPGSGPGSMKLVHIRSCHRARFVNVHCLDGAGNGFAVDTQDRNDTARIPSALEFDECSAIGCGNIGLNFLAAYGVRVRGGEYSCSQGPQTVAGISIEPASAEAWPTPQLATLQIADILIDGAKLEGNWKGVQIVGRWNTGWITIRNCSIAGTREGCVPAIECDGECGVRVISARTTRHGTAPYLPEADGKGGTTGGGWAGGTEVTIDLPELHDACCMVFWELANWVDEDGNVAVPEFSSVEYDGKFFPIIKLAGRDAQGAAGVVASGRWIAVHDNVFERYDARRLFGLGIVRFGGWDIDDPSSWSSTLPTGAYYAADNDFRALHLSTLHRIPRSSRTLLMLPTGHVRLDVDLGVWGRTDPEISFSELRMSVFYIGSSTSANIGSVAMLGSRIAIDFQELWWFNGGGIVQSRGGQTFANHVLSGTQMTVSSSW